MTANEYSLPLIRAFVSLQIIGSALFVINIFAACFSQKHNPRGAIWYSFSFSWVVFGCSYALLALLGMETETPPIIPCTVQAAMVYAVPALTGLTTTALMFELLSEINVALSGDLLSTTVTRIQTILLIMFPWMISIAIFLGHLVFGLQHPDFVALSPQGTFCTLINVDFIRIAPITATVASGLILTIEGIIAFQIFRHRSVISKLAKLTGMVIRAGVFTVVGIATLCLSVLYSITQQRNAQFDVGISLVIVFAAIIYGSHHDLLGLLFYPCLSRMKSTDLEETLPTNVAAKDFRATYTAGLGTEFWHRDATLTTGSDLESIAGSETPTNSRRNSLETLR